VHSVPEFNVTTNFTQPQKSTDDFEFDDFDDSPSKPKAILHNFIACDNEHLSVEFRCSKLGAKTEILAQYNNKTGFMIEDISVKIMAAKHLTMNILPLNVDEMMPDSKGEMNQVRLFMFLLTTQTIIIVNDMDGQKGLAMKMRLTYSFNGSQETRDFTITNFPF
jgi:hypothetical protein